MSQVTRALSRLGRVVTNLEGVASGLEASLSGQQRDMFAAPVSASNTNTSDIDKELVAKKLDLAIEKIEEILDEEEKEQAHG